MLHLRYLKISCPHGAMSGGTGLHGASSGKNAAPSWMMTQHGALPTIWKTACQKKAFAALDALLATYVATPPKLASRQASEQVIDVITKAQSNLIGGSADLTHSNLTKGKSQSPVSALNFQGAYLHFGVRKHAMGAAMNGIALHGGFRAYGGTFLVFSDFARPSSACQPLMGLPVTYVMTHDSIGLGEDGPTHQPVNTLLPCGPCRTCWCSDRQMRVKRLSVGVRHCCKPPPVLTMSEQASACAHRRARGCVKRCLCCPRG